MRIINETQLDFDDVLICPQTTNLNKRGDVDIIRNYKSLSLNTCPIMPANMTQTGNFAIARKMLENRMFATLHKFYNHNEIEQFITEDCKDFDTANLFITIGIRNKDEEIQKLQKLVHLPWSILIDVPNAYIPAVEDLVKECRQLYPNRIIAVGNVCTGDRTQELIKIGANIVKIGIGPSPICNTRTVTGVGRSQLSAIIECADAAHQVGGYIIADGGFKNTGDICKALVAGADICMSGSLFAGSKESSGPLREVIERTNQVIRDLDGSFLGLLEEKKLYKEYWGMSSFRAQQENYNTQTKTGTSEGVENMLISYTGPVQDTIEHIQGALRSCGTYIGAKNVKYFSRQGNFYKANRIK